MRPVKIKHARHRFEASRDDHGVPHIKSASWRGALYGLGFMHAMDRPTQMLFAHAVASGRSAELIADRPELLETDRFFRRAGLYLKLDEEVHDLDDVTFGHLTAYCEGVNDGMSQTRRSLPMWATRFYPHPWNQKAVLLIGNLLSYGGLVVTQQQNERLVLELIQAGVGDEKLKELFSPLLDDADFELLRSIKIASQLSDEALELLTDLPRLVGSNAWAVSPWRSATGSALLASDPHLEVNRLPAVWYEAVLRWDGDYVMGATLPGCPLVAVGRSKKLAWGATYMKGDTSDYFIEDCRPVEDERWQYRRGQTWHDFELRRELIRRKGKAAEVLRVFHNEQGTLEVDPQDREPGYHLSLKWIGEAAGAGKAIKVWFDLAASKSVAAAMRVVRDCPHPALCWVLADREGHIGLQGGGWFPDRPAKNTGLLPPSAWDEQTHWRGKLSSEQLPQVYDPPEGFVATANEDINHAGGPQLVTSPLPDYRKRRIAARLAELPMATVGDMQELQYDMVSMQARDLLGVFLPHLPEGTIRQRLEAWDCRYHPESTEATLFTHFYRNVLLEVFGQAPTEHGGIGWRRMLYLSTRAGYSTMILTCIDRLLKRKDSIWWRGRDKGELIRRAAQRLADEVDQPWSKVNSFQFTNRFIGAERFGRVLGFHTPVVPMPGCHATPFQGHLLSTAKRTTTFAPSYHFVTDLESDEAWTNLPGGPSESPFSPYYKNGIPLWRTGTYKQLKADEGG